jgi:hypothetical protein
MRLSTVIAALLAASSVAFADSSDLAEGVFIAHYAPSLTYTTDTPEGGWGAALQSSADAIRSCEDQINRLDGPIDHAMWFIISAWGEEKIWCTTQVGLEGYDPGVWLFQDNGPVYPGGGSGLEIYTSAFPSGDPVGGPSGVILGPEDGNWGPTNFEPVWWFEGYAYGSGYGTTLLQLGEDPATQFGGWFTCENPPGEFAASAFGGMGVNRPGVYACPGSGGDGWDEGAEGGEDEDGSGAEDGGTGVCCIDTTCTVVSAEDCSDAGGIFSAMGFTCDPNPCAKFAQERSEYPLISQIVRADSSVPNVFYLDPGADDELAFELCTVSTDVPTYLTVEIFDPRSASGDPVYSEENVEAGLCNWEGYIIDGIPWTRESGLAKVVVTTEGGEGNYYAFAPVEMTDPAATDREYFNGNIVARPLGDYWLPEYPDAHYLFWVPTMAAEMRLKLFADGGGDWIAEEYKLQDPEGNIVWEGTQRPQTYFESVVNHEHRGGIWELVVNTYDVIYRGDPYGFLEVSFQAEGSTEWWTPDFAFCPVSNHPPVPNYPVRAQFAATDVFFAPDLELPGPRSYYVPYGSPFDGYTEAEPSDPMESLVMGGRQRFMFAAHPGAGNDRTITVHNLAEPQRDRDPQDIELEWHTSSGPQDQGVTIPPEDTWSEIVPAGEILFVRVKKAQMYDITTDAPFAVSGPSAGWGWGKARLFSGGAASPEMFFFVPSDLDAIRMSVEAWRWCADTDPGECIRDPLELYNRAYPPTRLVLTDPGGSTHVFGPEEFEFGRLEASLNLDGDLAKYKGKAWKVRVETDDDHSGLGIQLVLGSGLPPYTTWLPEPERLFLPMAFRSSPRMVHSMETYGFSWSVIPPVDLYFGHAQTCSKAEGEPEDWTCSDPIVTLEQILTRTITPVDPAHKEMLSTVHYPWVPVADGVPSATTPPLLAYAVPRPMGLARDGSLRTTLGGEPQETEQFIELSSTTGPYAPGEPEGHENLSETQAAGFHLSDVRWYGDDPGWIDIAYVQYDQIASTGVPGINWEAPEWDEFESNVAQMADKGHLLYFRIVDEPFEHGIDSDHVYEALYRARKNDNRHPIPINEEPRLLNTQELGDLVEVWVEDEYLERRINPDWMWRFPLCEAATKIEEIRARVRDDVGTKIYLLAGFTENGVFVKATSDEAGAQGLACLLLGVDVTAYFLKMQGTSDLMDPDRNPLLWGMFDALNHTWDLVRRWKVENVVYDMGFYGQPVQECEWPPVTFGYGYWDEDLPQGWIGTWFAYANLAYEAEESVTLSWDDLHLSFDDNPGLLIEETSTSPPPVYWIDGEGLHLILPPGTWIVGNVRVPADLASADSEDSREPHLSIVGVPNPSASVTAFRVHASEKTSVRLTLFDSTGRVVTELRRSVSPGANQIDWDGLDATGTPVASGIYCARIVEEQTGMERTCWVVRVR